MENRREVVNEYFQLRTFLNRGNTRPNQISELQFKVRSIHKTLELIANVESGHENHGLVLAVRPHNTKWRPAGFSNFHVLEKHCASLLSAWQRNSDLKTIEARINAELKCLGIVK